GGGGGAGGGGVARDPWLRVFWGRPPDRHAVGIPNRARDFSCGRLAEHWRDAEDEHRGANERDQNAWLEHMDLLLQIAPPTGNEAVNTRFIRPVPGFVNDASIGRIHRVGRRSWEGVAATRCVAFCHDAR